jgi:hypothetical protein
MRAKYRLFLVMMMTSCVALPSSRAQSTTTSAEVHTEAGLHRVFFRVPQGIIRVNYPDDMAVGDSISGTVYTEPAGKTQKEQDKNSGELSGYVIEKEGQKTPASEKRFQWLVPAKAAGGLSAVLLRDRRGTVVARSVVPVDPRPAPADQGGFDLPYGAQAGTFVSASVPASPEPGSSVTVGGDYAPVIAESPRKVVFLTPQGVAGPSTLRVTKNGASAEVPFRSLRLELGATKRALFSGETATITASIYGLQGSKEPTWVVITNHSPSVVNLAGGAVQQIVIQPNEIQVDGTFQLTRVLTGEMGGAYNITVLVTRPPSSQLPLRRLADRTIERWSQTNNIPVSPEARSLITSGIDEARPRLDEFLMAQMVLLADPVSVMDWLVRDYCFDLRDLRLRSAGSAARQISRRGVSGNAFLQQPAVSFAIVASDVHGFSFVRYLARLLARLTPSQAVGDLIVTSEPTNQMITIDAASGQDYFTARSFVVSVGAHAVSVGPCKEVVSVNAYQKATMSCPHH